MPQSPADLMVPAYPTQPGANWRMKGLAGALQADVRAAEKAPNPARALSWNAHDQDTQNIVSQYNDYLRSTPGYQSLDWQLIKAMLWVETSPTAPDDQWDTAPMQSANKGDVGWRDMMNNANRMSLIVPPNLRSAVAFPNLRATDNIAAGVAYLLYRAATFGPQTQLDKNNIKSVVVSRGDSLYSIARKVGTTEQILRDMNSHAPLYPLKVGIKLNYVPANTVTIIIGWQSINPQSTYRLYNANGLGAYGDEVQFLYDLIRKNKILN